MIDLSQNGWGHNDIIALLESREGLAKTKYRVDVIRNGVQYGTVEYISCSINCDCEADVKYDMKITMRPFDGFQISTDFLQPVMYIEQEEALLEFPFVPMKPMTPEKNINYGYEMWDVQCYDSLVMLKTSSLGRIPYFVKGQTYTTIIEQELNSSGYQQINIEPSPLTLEYDREDWEIGDKKLQVYNALLREINYTDLAPDIDGVIYSKKYNAPTVQSAGIQYTVSKSNIIPEKTSRTDSYAVPNIFIGTASNPDMEEPLYYEFMEPSTDPSNPASIVNNGGYPIYEVLNFTNIADRQTLIDAVHRRASEVMAMYERVSVITQIMPNHAIYESIIFNCVVLNVFLYASLRMEAVRRMLLRGWISFCI